MTNCLLFQCGKPSHLCAPRVEGPLVIGNEITARKSQTDLTQAWRGDKEHILATYIEQVHNLPQGALLLPPPPPVRALTPARLARRSCTCVIVARRQDGWFLQSV